MKMKMKKNIVFRTLLLLSVAFLNGCMMAPSNIKDGKTIIPEKGILVVGLHTDWEGHDDLLLASLKLMFIGDNDPGFAGKNLTFQGENHITVIDLYADTYHFYKQVFGGSYLDIDKESKFTIKPHTITYIGDITSNLSFSGFSAASTLVVEDNFDETKAYLTKEYPMLVKKYPLSKQIVRLKVK
jgi:hypothetical protein